MKTFLLIIKQMTKQKIEYKWENLWINKFKQVRKSEGITAAKLKKEYWFTAKQNYDKEDVLQQM